MKYSVLFLGVVAAGVRARCTSGCNVAKCLSGIGEAPEGEAFCSSWLTQLPLTTTVAAEPETVTSTITITDTVSAGVTLTTATITNTVGTVTNYARRAEPSTQPSEAILSQCSNRFACVSRACSSFLSTTSIVTVYEIATATAIAEETVTITETHTVNAIATAAATHTVTLPANPVINPGFDAGLAPWTDNAATAGSGSKIETLTAAVDICSLNRARCSDGRGVVRAYPPRRAGGTVSIFQNLVAQPSKTYAVSFLYRCLSYDSTSAIAIYYRGVLAGTAACPSTTGYEFTLATGIQFTTDATGQGGLEVRFLNPSGAQYLYYYADDFRVVPL